MYIYNLNAMSTLRMIKYIITVYVSMAVHSIISLFMNYELPVYYYYEL